MTISWPFYIYFFIKKKKKSTWRIFHVWDPQTFPLNMFFSWVSVSLWSFAYQFFYCLNATFLKIRPYHLMLRLMFFCSMLLLYLLQLMKWWNSKDLGKMFESNRDSNLYVVSLLMICGSTRSNLYIIEILENLYS